MLINIYKFYLNLHTILKVKVPRKANIKIYPNIIIIFLSQLCLLNILFKILSEESISSLINPIFEETFFI